MRTRCNRFAWGIFLLIGLPALLAAALKLPPKTVKGKLVNDLPPPYNLQATVKGQSVALQWRWRAPEQQPLFTDFGYEILRQDGVSSLTAENTFVDLNLDSGTYTYKVRVRGGAKDHLTHVSSWSETVEAPLAESCRGVPQVDLHVQPTQKTYDAISSLHMHLTGRVVVPAGCTAQNITYHIDAETGASHTGSLKTGRDGRFDASVDALGPEDEIPEGQTSFTVTVSADDEAGPATSDAYTVAVQLQNKFAPH